MRDPEVISNWVNIISAVDKTDIPLEFVNSIGLEFYDDLADGIDQDINVQSLRKKGYDDTLVEDIVNRTISECKGDIKELNFYLDVEYVADTVQEQTDKLLRHLQ